jgi:biopolymer transport protein ExbB
MNTTRFIDFMNSGGPVNWVILCLYVITLAFLTERVVYFFRSRMRNAQFFAVIEHENFSKIEASLTKHEKRSPLYKIAKIFADNVQKQEQALSEIIDRQSVLIKREMERGLIGFSFIATISPLLGLLGTITGLMSAFFQIELRGSAADISFLSGGIREAMITTATGLVTAICALASNKVFECIIARRLQDMAVTLSLLTEKNASFEKTEHYNKKTCKESA